MNLTDSEKILGLSKIWKEAEYNFVYFDRIEKEKWDGLYIDYIEKVLDTKTLEEYYKILRSFANLLNDGHTGVCPPEEVIEEYGFSNLKIKYFKGDFYITDASNNYYTSEIIGAKIIKINDICVPEYIKRIRPFLYRGSIRHEAEMEYVANFLVYDKLGNIYTLEIQCLDENIKKIDIKIDRQSKRLDLFHPDLSTTFNLIDNISYMKVNSFLNDEGIKTFKENLDIIKSSKGVVLDIRENSGGNTSNGIEILKYFTNIDIHKSNNSLYCHNGFYKSIGKENEIIYFNNNISKNNIDINLDIPLVILTSPKTFSAAEDFCVAAKQNKIGILIGSNTAGSTGNPYYFDLPGGGNAYVCTIHCKFADGTDFMSIGVEPNIYIKMQKSDVLGNTDAVLKYAIEYINSK